MRDQVRYHPPELIDRLLLWCERMARTRPEETTAVGLAYIHGLNEHQIAATTVLSADIPKIEYPQARRAAEIRKAKRASLELDEPDWLRTAVMELARDRAPGTFLYQRRSAIKIPVRVCDIAALVAAASAEATGARATIKTLNGTRAVAVRETGTPLALHGIGYAPSWAARLAGARPILILPRSTR